MKKLLFLISLPLTLASCAGDNGPANLPLEKEEKAVKATTDGCPDLNGVYVREVEHKNGDAKTYTSFEMYSKVEDGKHLYGSDSDGYNLADGQMHSIKSNNRFSFGKNIDLTISCGEGFMELTSKMEGEEAATIRVNVQPDGALMLDTKGKSAPPAGLYVLKAKEEDTQKKDEPNTSTETNTDTSTATDTETAGGSGEEESDL